MAKRLICELTNEQESSLQQYIESPSNQDWEYSEKFKANLPKPKWATIDDWFDWAFGQIIQGPLSMFPPASDKAKLDQIAALQAELEAGRKPQRVAE